VATTIATSRMERVTPIIRPGERSSSPEIRADVVSPGRHSVGDDFGGGVFRYPRMR